MNCSRSSEDRAENVELDLKSLHESDLDADDIAAIKELDAWKDHRAKHVLLWNERARRIGQQRREWERLLDAARARIHAAERQAKTDARRARDVVRRRQERAGQITAKRIAALDRACAKPCDPSLVKLRGRSEEFAYFREALTVARQLHGPKASLTEIAAVYTTMMGMQMEKNQARNRLKIVTSLESPGGAWYRLRNL